MSSAALPASKPVSERAGDRPRFVPLWRDYRRVLQYARLKALAIQSCDDAGMRFWEECRLLRSQFPRGVRIDLPSPRAFARILGVYRTAATLKKDPMERLELSAEEIAELAGYSKTTAEAVLRWLGCEPIEYNGVKVASGLGIIHRGRRTAKAYIEGMLQNAYRTSRTILTMVGRSLLNLIVNLKERRRDKPVWLRPFAQHAREPEPDLDDSRTPKDKGAEMARVIHKMLL